MALDELQVSYSFQRDEMLAFSGCYRILSPYETLRDSVPFV